MSEVFDMRKQKLFLKKKLTPPFRKENNSAFRSLACFQKLALFAPIAPLGIPRDNSGFSPSFRPPTCLCSSPTIHPGRFSVKCSNKKVSKSPKPFRQRERGLTQFTAHLRATLTGELGSASCQRKMTLSEERLRSISIAFEPSAKADSVD